MTQADKSFMKTFLKTFFGIPTGLYAIYLIGWGFNEAFMAMGFGHGAGICALMGLSLLTFVSLIVAIESNS
jgi:hypothetical protein